MRNAAVCSTLAIAVAFGRAGWHVVANFRREQAEADVTAAMIIEAGGSVELRQADVAVPDQAARLFADLAQVDALVNNAGITRDAPFATMTLADWQSVIATNFNAVATCTRAAVPLMMAAGGGAVINIGSSAAASGSCW